MKIAVVGCGYVADFYFHNLSAHPDLSVAGAYDRNAERLKAFCTYYNVPKYDSFEKLLALADVELVLNLTNPREHFVVSTAILEAGKHVYTEKPLAMTGQEAAQLVDLATAKGLRIGCAPCSALNDTAQTTLCALRKGVIGQVRVVYANYDDGFIAPKKKPWQWRSASQAPWPAKDEFEVGSTYEHAGYFLTWLAAMFGPATSVTAYSACLIPDKGISVDGMAPDFSAGCIEYGNGVVARVTCGLAAPEDKSLTIVGDHGVICVPDLRNDKLGVWVRRDAEIGHSALDRLQLKLRANLTTAVHRFHLPLAHHAFYQKYPLMNLGPYAVAGKRKPVSFLRGVQDMVDALRSGQPHRLSAELGLHIVEIIEALEYPERFNFRRTITSRFAPIEPLQK